MWQYRKIIVSTATLRGNIFEKRFRFLNSSKLLAVFGVILTVTVAIMIAVIAHLLDGAPGRCACLTSKTTDVKPSKTSDFTVRYKPARPDNKSAEKQWIFRRPGATPGNRFTRAEITGRPPKLMGPETILSPQ